MVTGADESPPEAPPQPPPTDQSNSDDAKKVAKRPDFTSEAQYERLVPIMGVSSVIELNSSGLRHSDFQKKASELTGKLPGSFKSWASAIAAILSVPATAPDSTHASGAEAAADTEEAADIDGPIADALHVVGLLLAGEKLDDDLHLDDDKLYELERALATHIDALEHGVREQFESMAESDLLVSDLLGLTKVRSAVGA
jgi:hypothetical protein